MTIAEDLDADTNAWLIKAGLQGSRQGELFAGLCERLLEGGIPLLRAYTVQRTLHPIYRGHGYQWHRDDGIEEANFDRSQDNGAQFQRSPFFHMLTTRSTFYRERLIGRNEPSRFELIEELRSKGATDYMAFAVSFAPDEASFADGEQSGRPLAGVITSWATDAAEGFTDDAVAVIEAVLPSYGLAAKAVATYRMSADVLATYLGKDAGRRVLEGGIDRGDLQTVRAVIWYFDLQGFTKLSESHPGDQVIAMLNDYFGVVVDVVQQHGGDVLKFMGDGLLAIFRFEDDDHACCSALDAADELVGRMTTLSRARETMNEPAAPFNLALHLGDVLYGNIGGADRLDFTVVGPAVNEAARIEAMCRPLERDLVISAAFARAVHSKRERIVSLGRYALRGVREPQELFTLVAPEFAAP